MRVHVGVPLVLALAMSLSACVGSPAHEEPPAGECGASTCLAGTGQSACYGLTLPITCPSPDQALFGQDAHYQGPSPRFSVHGDGTVTDLVTGLTWTQALGDKVTWDAAMAEARNLTTGGHRDWRVPTLKELYSLMDFRGQFGLSPSDSRPFIDTSAFEFRYHTAPGGRFFDVQTWSSTRYVGRTMNGDISVFGVNFADGRIKSYPQYIPGTNNTQPAAMYVRFVRGAEGYGRNAFIDNLNGTITDQSTGLVWQQGDDGVRRNWSEALAYCEALSLGGASDWRLPNAKELQSIVDYTRSPSVTGTAAIEPIFQVSNIESYYWTSTTVLEGPPDRIASRAVYIAFGRALGWMEMPPGSGNWRLLDAHGAGAQRSDLKDGDPAAFPRGFGPQGDDVRIYNSVRCVRGRP